MSNPLPPGHDTTVCIARPSRQQRLVGLLVATEGTHQALLLVATALPTAWARTGALEKQPWPYCSQISFAPPVLEKAENHSMLQVNKEAMMDLLLLSCSLQGFVHCIKVFREAVTHSCHHSLTALWEL